MTKFPARLLSVFSTHPPRIPLRITNMLLLRTSLRRLYITAVLGDLCDPRMGRCQCWTEMLKHNQDTFHHENTTGCTTGKTRKKEDRFLLSKPATYWSLTPQERQSRVQPRYVLGSIQALNRQNYLDTHVLALMHQFSINQNLVGANAIPHCISRICRCGDLDLTPLLVRWHELALGS